MCDCCQASIQAGAIEPVVWEFVRGMLLDPERVGAGMERMIATERETSKGSPEKEARMWSEKLRRSRTQPHALPGDGCRGPHYLRGTP